MQPSASTFYRRWFLFGLCATSLAAIDPVTAADPAPQHATGVRFKDVGAGLGFREPLTGLMGHGGAWGDFDQDGRPDFFAGGFCDRPDTEYQPAAGPVLPKLLRNAGEAGFAVVEDPALAVVGRTSGAIFADLDNDGTLELFIANNARPHVVDKGRIQDQAKRSYSALLKYASGKWVDVSKASGACEAVASARNVAVLDFNRDGLLDLFVVEDHFVGRGRTPRSALLENLGQLKFRDATAASGLPSDIQGLGSVTADFNDDGFTDLFIPFDNRFFLGAAQGQFTEWTKQRELFDWKGLNGEDWPCGAAVGDLDRDGRLDLVVAIHGMKARNKVFLQVAAEKGGLQFEDATRAVGLPEFIPTRCPHVEVQDFDNDGWPDLFFSAGWTDGADFIPLVFRHAGLERGRPRFVAARDPSEVQSYYPAAPTADFDGDGRLDIACVSWYPDQPSRLLKNESPLRHYLAVEIQDAGGNRQGIGSRIDIFTAGQTGKAAARLGCQEISTGYGYASGQPSIAHFGLGDATEVDLVIRTPDGKRRTISKVAADQRYVVRGE